MEKQSLWTKDFIIISIINFFIMMVMYLLMVTIAPYAVEEFGASTGTAGLVSGIFIIGTLIARIGSGNLIAKIGSKKLLFIGLVVFLIGTGLYFGAVSLPLLLATRLIHGIGLGFASTATGTMVAKIIPPTRRGEGIGYFSMSTVLSTAIGPFLGIFMSQHYPFQVLFWICLALSIVNMLMFFFVREEEVAPMSNHVKEKRHSQFIEKRALPISIITLFVGLSYSGVLSFLSFYAKEINVVKAASFFFLVYAFVVLLSRPFSGKLLDEKGAKFIVYPALILFAGGLLLLSQAHNGFMLLVAGAIIGLGFGNFQSCAQAIALKGIEIDRIGVATSTFYIFLDCGFGFGPYLLGQLIPHTGYSGMYVTLTAVVLLSLFVFVLLFGKRRKGTMEVEQ
ncbi:MFS family permease [Sporosarcina luteola]|nr:MFS family permease [Sporosarcina luteola]